MKRKAIIIGPQHATDVTRVAWRGAGQDTIVQIIEAESFLHARANAIEDLKLGLTRACESADVAFVLFNGKELRDTFTQYFAEKGLTVVSPPLGWDERFETLVPGLLRDALNAPNKA